MTKDEALDLALEALEKMAKLTGARWALEQGYAGHLEAITAIKQARSAPVQEPVAWREHVEQRIRTWRQRTINKSGDMLAIDDFMGQDSIDDLVDFVCDEWVEPAARSAPVQENTMIYKTFEQWKSGNVLEHGVPRTEYYSEDQLDLVEMGWKYGYDAGRAVEQALDKKAENARELGLDYEPVDWEAIAADQAMTIALLKSEAAAQPAPVQEPIKPDTLSLEQLLRAAVYWGATYAKGDYHDTLEGKIDQWISLRSGATPPAQPAPVQEQAEQLAKLGWQTIECPFCGSSGAQAFPKAAAQPAPVQEPVITEGWERRKVIGFDALVEALDYAERKGFMPDYIANAWEGFNYLVDEKNTPPAAQPAPAQEPEPEEWDERCVLGHCGSPTGCELSNRCRADNPPAAPVQWPIDSQQAARIAEQQCVSYEVVQIIAREILASPPAAPVQEPDKHLQLALEALAPLEKLLVQADEQGLLNGANVDCQIATIELRKSAYAASDIRAYLNTTPPAAQRQWVGLTDEEIEQEFGFIDELLRDCVHRTEAKLKEKNT